MTDEKRATKPAAERAAEEDNEQLADLDVADDGTADAVRGGARGVLDGDGG